MEESVRIILNPIILNRRFLSKPPQSLRFLLLHNPRKNLPLSSIIRCCDSRPFSPRNRFSNSSPLGFLSSSSSSIYQNLSHRQYSSDVYNSRLNVWCNDGGSIDWYGAEELIQEDGGSAVAKRESEVMVVLLGWLGAKPRHLMKYAELYVARGCGAVTFAVSVSNVLWFDLGRSVEEKVEELENRLVSWLEGEEEGGRGRCLVFHTFSNTGWLVYGSILGHLQSRPEIIDKIRGCIVDSGAAPELSPQVWAAGFATAMLKKRSYVVHSSAEAGELNTNGTMLKVQEEEISSIESLLLFILEATFSFLLKLPDVYQRLSKIMFILSESQPSCPQLYLYSTADKVIPYRSVESFIEDQKRIGKKVQSFNFISSPHVDHYRRFPDKYTSLIINFLNECLDTAKQR